MTAKTIEDRLAQLIGANSPDSSDIAEVASNLSAFQASQQQLHPTRRFGDRTIIFRMLWAGSLLSLTSPEAIPGYCMLI